jgi:hypothetical protein
MDDVDHVIPERERVASHCILVRRVVDAIGPNRSIIRDHDVAVLPGDLWESP